MRPMKKSDVEWIGEIPVDWGTSKLKYLGSYINGYAFKPDDWGDKGRRIIRIQDLTGSNDNPNYYDGEVPDKYVINDGDILVSWAATLDAFIWNKGEGLLNQHIFKAVPDLKRIDYDFFFWMIKEAMKNMNNDNKHGIFMQHVTLDVFNNFTIPIPKLDEQRCIAKHLDSQCAYIDKIIEKTKVSINEYKKLRQTVVTQAVTEGVRGDRLMKDSGIEWIGKIPREWEVYRIAALYSERKENGNDELPILTVSINTGVSDRELSDDESERVFVRSEDKSKYMRVYPGDLTYNMMRAWQGAFGAVRVDGMVSPAYVIVKPRREIDNRYMEALLRTQPAKEEMKRYSHGIADFRLRLYWDKFRTIKVCLPPIEEQKEISDYIDQKCAEIDVLISKKEQFLIELERYKESMIYEYVTGKREVPHS